MSKNIWIGCVEKCIISKRIKILLNVFILLTLTSCDCEGDQQDAKMYQARIVLDRIPKQESGYYKLYGRDPVTNKDTVQKLPARWLMQLNYMYEIGDTIIKDKGSISIFLHKVNPKFDTTKFECVTTCDDYITNGQNVEYWRKKLRALGYPL